MLTIILIDSELETIPEEMWNDPAVRKLASSRKKSPQKLLLDSNFLHTSIERTFPGMSTRRGRPDIFHTFLNVVNDTILNRKGNLRVYIHTRNNKVITVNPETRIPKSYNRFVGLMEDLFLKGTIAADEHVLLKVENLSAQEAVRKYAAGRTVVMSPGGIYSRVRDIIQTGDMTVVIGGFAEGDYISDLSFIGEKYSLFEEELTIWTVASEIINECERSLEYV